LDSFGRAPKNVTDAYILWALTSSSVGLSMNLTFEIDSVALLAN